MNNGIFNVPTPINEPVLTYAPNSPEKKLLKAELERQTRRVAEVKPIIDGKEHTTANKKRVVMPHNHRYTIAELSVATPKEIKLAIKSAQNAKNAWANMPFEHRASIFLRASELISTKYRYILNASTMLGQGKTVAQAELDSATELADFLRFNVHFAQEIYKNQPTINSQGVWNRMEYRPLEGFVAVISPFNFTAIAGNLCVAPAIMGNTIVWKPSATAVLSNYYLMQLFKEAGLPDGVINFVPCTGEDANKYILTHSDLGGVHFTGSTAVFNKIWSTVGKNIKKYRSYPRIVGETGGKGFIFAHKSAEIDALVTALVRGAFEYQGQKCSACSRAFIPKSIYDDVMERLMEQIGRIKVGDVSDFSCFMGAVIDENAFNKAKKYIDLAKNSADAEVLCGGYNGDSGYFVYPTVIRAKKHSFVTMREEIFAPVLTVFVYDDADIDKALGICDSGANYGLTGAIFATEREAIVRMERALVNTAGNLYINDKPTGMILGQQPFGGGRSSGTNDKAGSTLNLTRWTSARTIKEVMTPPTSFEYPSMKER